MAIDIEDAYERAVESEQVGAFIITPQAALDKVNLINADMGALNGVITSSGKARPEFLSTWTTFYDGWKAFYESNGPGFSGWVSRLWASSYEQALEYEKKLASWYDAVRKEGIAVSNPGAPQQESEIPWKWVLVAGGLFLGYILVKEVGRGVGSAVDTVTKKVVQ